MKNGTILLVEDNPDDELLTTMALKKSNVCNVVKVVRDGAEALEYLFASGAYTERDITDLPAVVLLDLQLPKIHGLEVLQRIREHDVTKTMPVVVLTSSDEERDMVKSYKLGANSYVRKPVDFEEFNEAVRQLGLYWMLVNDHLPGPIGGEVD
jgi:two-component system, response regulator